MVSDPSSAYRDLVYAAAFAAGIAVALMVPARWFGDYSARAAARRGSMAAIAWSIAVALFAAAFIRSDAAVLADFALQRVAVAFAVAGCLATLAPRLFGFPLVVAVCSSVILFAWSFLVYPAALPGSAVARLRLSADSSILVWLGDSAPVELDVARGSPIALGIISARIDPRWPLVGGTTRIAVRRLLSVDRELAIDIRRSLVDLLDAGGNTLGAVPGVSLIAEASTVPGDLLIDGARITAVWTGNALSFEK